MGTIEILLISIGLAMDAFAVSICKGLSIKKMNWKNAIIIGMYFGIFQAGMPILGYFLRICRPLSAVFIRESLGCGLHTR